jgi:hypothetical protein
MENEYEADVVLDWMDTRRGPRGERLEAAQVQAGVAVPQIGDCKQGWQLEVQAMFAAEFPVAQEQHKAEARLAACRQASSMGRHIIEYNMMMAKSRRCVNSEAARSSLTCRAELKRFINSCVDRLPIELRSVYPPRVYLLRRLHRLKNMQMLQEEAKAYCKDVVQPLALDAGMQLAACWTVP